MTQADDGVLRIDFGDGVSALDRTMRALTMLLDGAIGEIVKLGYDRNLDMITIEYGPDTLPAWITVRGRRVFEVSIGSDQDAESVSLTSRWIHQLSEMGWLKRAFLGQYRA